MTRATLSHPVPPPVLRAAVLAGVEAAALALACALYLRAIVAGDPSDRGSALLGAGMGLALAALLGVAARALARGRRPALTPVVLTQLFLLPVSWNLFRNGQWAVATLTTALSLAILSQLFGSAQARRTFS